MKTLILIYGLIFFKILTNKKHLRYFKINYLIDHLIFWIIICKFSKKILKSNFYKTQNFIFEILENYILKNGFFLFIFIEFWTCTLSSADPWISKYLPFNLSTWFIGEFLLRNWYWVDFLVKQIKVSLRQERGIKGIVSQKEVCWRRLA